MKRKSKNQSKNKTLNFLRYLGPGASGYSRIHRSGKLGFEYCGGIRFRI